MIFKVNLKEKDEEKLVATLQKLQTTERQTKHAKFTELFKKLRDCDVSYIMSKKRKNLVDFIVYKDVKMKLIWFNNDVYLQMPGGSREYGISFANKILTEKTIDICVD